MTQTPRNPEQTTIATSLVGLLVLGILYTLYFAHWFMVPIVAAVVLFLILSPVVRTLARYHVPAPVTGVGLVVLLIAMMLLGASVLADPIEAWVKRAPQISWQINQKIKVLREPVEAVKRASEQVEKLADVGSSQQQQTQVTVDQPSLLERGISILPGAGAQIFLTFMMLLFLLSSHRWLRRTLISLMPTRGGMRRAGRMLRDVERRVSTYLLTISIINIGFGICLGIGMHVIGMPNPVLWGVMGAVLNFIPYLGHIVMLAVLLVVALVSLDTLTDAALVCVFYLALNTLEAYIVTPSLIGVRLTIHPVVIFVAVAFWGWMWGPVGALMAIPLIVIAKVVADHYESLAPLNRALGGAATGPGTVRRRSL